MKKSIAIAAVLSLAASGAFAQVDLSDFQSAFEGFAGDMAGALAVNSTIGSNWSDAYIGKFPHFGAGVSAGAAFASSASAKTLFENMGGSLPSELESLGVPIPAAVATAKIGIPFLPIDIGIKGGYIPESVGKAINAASDMTVDYKNIGAQIRFAVIKQSVVLPNISIGAAYNYQEGSITAPLDAPGANATYDVVIPSGPSAGTYHINAQEPEAALAWKSNTFDFTVQVSKKLLFIVPYAGAGLTIGTSSVTGGAKADVTTDFGANDLQGLMDAIEAAGGTAPDISSTGVSFAKDAKAPVFRVYGGLSLRILVDLDLQAMYVPATKSLGGSATIRLQL
jgi:hypothetical protein